MSDFHLVIPNQTSVFTLTATSEAPGDFAIENIYSAMRSKVWRSTSTSAQQISGTSATGASLGGVALAKTNLSSAATVRFRGYSDAAWSSLVIDSTATGLPTGADFWQFFFTNASIKSWYLDIADAANADGYMQVGGVILGYDYSPTWGPSWGPSFDYESTTTLEFTEAGSPVSDAGLDFQSVSVQFEHTTYDEAQGIDDAIKSAGIGGVGWICLDDTFTGSRLIKHTGEFAVTEHARQRMATSQRAPVSIGGRVL